MTPELGKFKLPKLISLASTEHSNQTVLALVIWSLAMAVVMNVLYCLPYPVQLIKLVIVSLVCQVRFLVHANDQWVCFMDIQFAYVPSKNVKNSQVWGSEGTQFFSHAR